MNPISALSPPLVWQHFLNLCSIPHASGREAAVREALSEWARKRGLGVMSDRRGNLLLSKPATVGHENRPGVVLQGHLDMVCQKHSHSAHDFDHDPILPVLREGWVTATDTTLGADNGIGVALALAVLEDNKIQHPALEVLLTVDEEVGMHGALALEPGFVKGRLLLNLDTEQWGELYVGCAGSVDVVAETTLPTEAVPAHFQTLTLSLTGLAGGHSGIDIHRQRGNAIKLLARLLRKLAERIDFRIASMQGGTAHNAIAREAEATLCLSDAAPLQAQAEELMNTLRHALNDEDSHARLDFTPVHSPGQALTGEASRKVLALLDGLPYGVRKMSAQAPDVVETSNNIGELRLQDGHLHTNMMVRSLNAEDISALADEIVAQFVGSGFDTPRTVGAGPVWQPKMDSRLLALAREVYRKTFGSEARVTMIHAGLECGAFSALWPDMDMISFGPTIHGAHSPNERVETGSVERAWQLLAGILAAIPQS